MTQEPAEGRQRGIRSYVIRAGRLTSGQERALGDLLPRYGLDPAGGFLDTVDVFGRSGPLVLEVGFGMGQSLAAMAQARPDECFIGVEVHPPGVGSLLLAIESAGLGNLRVFHCDVNEVLARCIAPESLHRVQVYFPDPWPKKRHHKRRLVQPAFLDRLWPLLQAGGLFHMASDWKPYIDEVLDWSRDLPGWQNHAGAAGVMPRPPWRPQTRFEARGFRHGHDSWDILLEKVAR